MEHQKASELIDKLNSGRLTPGERNLLEDWYLDLAKNRPLNFDQHVMEENLMANWKAIIEKLPEQENNKTFNSRKITRLITVAASILLIIGAGLFLYTYRANNQSDRVNLIVNDIAPGGNKAFLTLSDGKRIILTDAKNGELAEQSGVKITKTAQGQLIYTVSNLPNEKKRVNVYNTIETPRGGTYQLRLPDGTKVWLNAASTLRFPASFASAVNRKVELLRGEAYFEVSKDKEHPFIVQSLNQTVEVLGTHFNINQYANEMSTKTTLLEGAVKVITMNGSSKTLIPGQQSQITKTSIAITENIDLEDVTSWKNGYFKFSGSLESIMNKVSRWYDVDIVYETKPNDAVFNGKISRNRSLKELLNMLEFAADLHFKIEGRRVVVKR